MDQSQLQLLALTSGRSQLPAILNPRDLMASLGLHSAYTHVACMHTYIFLILKQYCN